MEAVYRWKGDKRILLYEEGNQILAQVIGTGRTVQWGSLCRDYHSCGVSLFWEDEIYVAYVNTENVLMWDKLFAEGLGEYLYGSDRTSRRRTDTALCMVSHGRSGKWHG